MIFKAQPQFSKSLLVLPESGMGYQIIDAKRYDKSTTDRFIVYNSELIVEYDNYFNNYKRQIMLEGYTKMFNSSNILNLEFPVLINRSSLSSIRIFSESNMNTKGRSNDKRGAIENNPVYVKSSENFVRLSAYQDDKRIDYIRKRIIDGTFTTTNEDYLNCKMYNDDPIDRYALPNEESIKWVFYINPKSIDRYRPGVVQAANNHNGGGIEALFDNGTSDNTYIERKPY
ncbi:MAG: hypothetical protein NTZ33_15670 [Bacteroidetes bacterium]|nr:hypothetical protein [Bacteroidota bacterium]